MSENTSSPKAAPQSKNILVVDDDPDVCTMLEMTLQAEGFKTKGAHDGRDIVNVATEFNAHLIVSDVMMPGGGGYELLRMLQSDPGTRDIPVVLITGATFNDSTRKMMFQEPNVKEFFEKPIKPALLTAKIHFLLNTKSKEEKMIEENKQNTHEIDLERFEDII